AQARAGRLRIGQPAPRVSRRGAGKGALPARDRSRARRRAAVFGAGAVENPQSRVRHALLDGDAARQRRRHPLRRADLRRCRRRRRDAAVRIPMKSLWNDADAAQFTGPLGLRVYTSRLLGRDKSLVLHGGGNTSVKLREKDVFGADIDVLYVKGSGSDLETIGAGGFAPVALEPVRRIASLAQLSDAQMVNELNTRVVRTGSPFPSVETLLHAILPHAYVDHTHADAVLSISNAPDGEKRIREIYGKRVAVIPYVMDGFDLASYCARELPKQLGTDAIGVVLLSHGIFSFGASARESYERMIELVSMAEDHLQKHKAWYFDLAGTGAATSRQEIASLRRAISGQAGAPMVLKVNQ